MREYAEAEVRVPNGPYAGRRYRCSYQPYAGLYLDEVDSGKYDDIYAVGPTQSGKTLTCHVLPVIYHLDELEETVISGVPLEDMASDKWREDILPVIRRSGKDHLLPKRGAASRGGKVDVAVTLTTGVTLRFMAGGGSDKTRSGFTSRILAVTEADGLDKRGQTSHEADKLTQLMGRTLAYGSQRRHYLECTTTIPEGAIWQGYISGTESRICTPCPHCKEYVTMEREHLHGWQQAESEIEARENAVLLCPACRAAWTEDDRKTANTRAVLAHRGQTVDRQGNVLGDAPRTRKLGFRWNCTNNMFVTIADIAAAEWNAAHDPNEDNAEREMVQQWWALPYVGNREEISQVTISSLRRRSVDEWVQGVMPDDTVHMAIAVDVGKRYLHWSCNALRETGAVHTVEYGIVNVQIEVTDELEALKIAFEEIEEMRQAGWLRANGREPEQAEIVLVDSGYQTKTVYEICRQYPGWYAVKGHGQSQDMAGVYRPPDKKSSTVRYVGDEYHVVRLSPELGRGWLIHGNADAWKSRVHDQLRVEKSHERAWSLCSGRDNNTLAIHLTAEKEVEEYDPKKGNVVRWERIKRQNHWFDSFWMSRLALDWASLGMPGLTRQRSMRAWRENYDRAVAANKKGR